MPALTLVRDVPHPTQGFATWLTAEQGMMPSSADAYAGDVQRLGIGPETTRVGHQQIAAAILDSPYAASTRTRRLAAAARYYDFLNPGAEADNPYRAVRRPRFGVVLPALVPTPDEARAVIEWFAAWGTRDGLMYAAATALLAGGGLRLSEAVGLPWASLDLDRGQLRVVGKGDKTRDVPLGEYATTVLRLYYDAVSERSGVRAGDLVVQVSARTLQRAIARAGEAVGKRGLHPHSFRHGFATAVHEGTGDLQLTADLLGHASLTTTKIYSHLSDRRRGVAANLAL